MRLKSSRLRSWAGVWGEVMPKWILLFITSFRSLAGLRRGKGMRGMGVRVLGWNGTSPGTGARGDVRAGKRGDGIVETETCFKSTGVQFAEVAIRPRAPGSVRMVSWGRFGRCFSCWGRDYQE